MTWLNVIQEKNSFLEMGLFLVALMVMLVLLLWVCQMAMSSGTWIPKKLLGVESSLIALAAQMHFSIPCVPLLANVPIITGFGNVHSQAFLVMDST